jgi:uncharacterized membrane protein YbaN (DUF454 family)
MQHDASAPSVGLSAPARWLLMGLAGLCLLLGIVGIFLPVMPTVPFLIVAAWAASRSSPRLHRWLMTHPRFGRQLRDWYEHGVVPRRAKWITSVMMAGSSISMLVIAPEHWIPAVLCLIAVMALVLAWLWRRPEHRPPEIAAE